MGVWDSISDFANESWDTVSDTAGRLLETKADRLVYDSQGGSSREPQNYVTGQPGADVSGAPATQGRIMGFTPVQLGLGAVALVGLALLAKRVL